jgi:hypothetical protein
MTPDKVQIQERRASVTPQSHRSGGDYDSRPDTYEHIAEVRGRLLNVAVMLIRRAHDHDASKLAEPELSVFNEYTPKLKDSTYGSDEYKSFLEGMGEGLRHHYAA